MDDRREREEGHRVNKNERETFFEEGRSKRNSVYLLSSLKFDDVERRNSNRLFFTFAGKEKLGVPQNENVSLVLESDGTQVEDGEYFKTLANNTILLLLRHGERWFPTGVDIIRAGIYLRRNFN